MKRRVLATLGGVLLLSGALTVYARAQEPATTNPEIERLKTQLAAQQEQIDQLRRVLEEQKKVLDQASQPKPPSLGQVASTTAIIPAGDVAPVLHPGLGAAVALPRSDTERASPLQLKIGTATITPLGFLDFTSVFRSADGGSGIGTRFGSTPYNNVSTGLGKLSEERFSAQNSRIGARIDALVHGMKVLAYWESDFLGTQSTNAGVTSNSNSFRMRLYFVDLKKGNWELLGGQSWSMLTPGRCTQRPASVVCAAAPPAAPYRSSCTSIAAAIGPSPSGGSTTSKVPRSVTTLSVRAFTRGGTAIQRCCNRISWRLLAATRSRSWSSKPATRNPVATRLLLGTSTTFGPAPRPANSSSWWTSSTPSSVPAGRACSTGPPKAAAETACGTPTAAPRRPSSCWTI